MRFKVAPRMLDHFGIAMYNTIPKAIAELCANAYDADAGVVRVTYEDDFISIVDNGVGMTAQQVDDDYLYLGRDRRDSEGDEGALDKTASGRAVIGNKGIGKLAGFGIAETMTLRTWRDGAQTEIRINRSDLDSVSDLSDLDLKAKTTATRRVRSGTEVRLTDFIEGTPPIDTEKLRGYLARHLPVQPSWMVRLNGRECTPEAIPGERHLIDDNIEGFGRVRGYYVVASDRRGLTPGMSVRVRGRVVAEPSLFGISQQAHGFFNIVRIVGELAPDFIDPVGKLQTRREQFVINTARSGFNPEDPAVQALEAYARAKLQTIAAGLAAERSNERRKEALRRNPEFEARLKSLGPEIYEKLDKALEELIAKLSRNEDDDTVDEVVDLIIRYYESDTLRIILETVKDAAPEEVARLSQLLARYGAAHIAEVAHILHTQIEVIDLLRRKVADKVLEAEIHSVIAKNVWLIRNDLSYWFDNQAFATKLGGNLAKAFKLEAKRRPDLACFDDRKLQPQQGKSPRRLVVIEFKRPGVTVGSAEMQQVMLYKSVFKASLGDIDTEGIEIIIIGDAFDANFDRSGLGKGYQILSYEELLENAHDRYSELYERLAPDGLPDEPSITTKKTTRAPAPKAATKKATAKATTRAKAPATKAATKKAAVTKKVVTKKASTTG